jgi:hypothetical protein
MLAVALFACSSHPLIPGRSGGASTTGGASVAPATADGSASSEIGSAGGAAGTTASAGTSGAAGTIASAGTNGAAGTIAAAGTSGAAGAIASAGTSGAAGASVDGGAGGESTSAGCPLGVLGHCNADTTAALNAHPGYALALAEEFDAPLDLDNDPIWTWSDGFPIGGQTRFREANISFTGGKMIITAESPCAAQAYSPGCIPAGDQSYTNCSPGLATGPIPAMGVWSGQFNTKYNNYRYGYYELRAKAPAANATLPLTDYQSGDYLWGLTLFRTPYWQDWNEIDLVLEANHNFAVTTQVVNGEGQTTFPVGQSQVALASASTLPAAFSIRDTHTYGFEWTPTQIVWFVDGEMVSSYSGGGGPGSVPSKSGKVTLNFWVFNGPTFGDGAQNVYPFQMEYEYFRFYRAPAAVEPTYPCSPLPTCLPVEDRDFSRNNPLEVNY